MKRLFPFSREFKKKLIGKRKCPCNLYSWSKTKSLESAWWGGVWNHPVQTKSVVKARESEENLMRFLCENQRNARVSGLVFGNKQGFWWLFRPSSWDGSFCLFLSVLSFNFVQALEHYFYTISRNNLYPTSVTVFLTHWRGFFPSFSPAVSCWRAHF